MSSPHDSSSHQSSSQASSSSQHPAYQSSSHQSHPHQSSSQASSSRQPPSQHSHSPDPDDGGDLEWELEPGQYLTDPDLVGRKYRKSPLWIPNPYVPKQRFSSRNSWNNTTRAKREFDWECCHVGHSIHNLSAKLIVTVRTHELFPEQR